MELGHWMVVTFTVHLLPMNVLPLEIGKASYLRIVSLDVLGDAPLCPTSPPIFLCHLCIFLLIVASPRRSALVAPIPEFDDHMT